MTFGQFEKANQLLGELKNIFEEIVNEGEHIIDDKNLNEIANVEETIDNLERELEIYMHAKNEEAEDAEQERIAAVIEIERKRIANREDTKNQDVKEIHYPTPRTWGEAIEIYKKKNANREE